MGKNAIKNNERKNAKFCGGGSAVLIAMCGSLKKKTLAGNENVRNLQKL